MGSVDDGKLKVKQCRNGEEIWSGEVRIWRGGDQPHGRRNSGAAVGQWETGDEIIGWQCECTVDNDYVRLHGDWDNPATDTEDYGKYFVFSNAEWEPTFGSVSSGKTLDVKQCRAGEEVWKGTVKIWNGHGR